MQNDTRVIETRVICYLLAICSLIFISNSDGSLKEKELCEQTFEQICVKNLHDAENFLSLIAKNRNINLLVPNKLYYEVVNEGTEPATPSATGLFHYKITTLDNTVIANTHEEGPKKVSLTNTIIGFAKGVEGMHYGEKRKLYIHPDLAYRKIGIVVPPQALLIIEVEAVAPVSTQDGA